MSETVVPVGLDVDGAPVTRAFDQIETRIAGMAKQLDGIMKLSAKVADTFGGKMQQELQKFNKIIGVLEQTERNLSKLQTSERTINRKVSGATAGAQVRADAGQFGVETTRSGLKFDRALAEQRLLTASTAEEKDVALAALKIAERKVRVIEAMAREEKKITAEIQQQNRAENARVRRGIAADTAPDQALRTRTLQGYLKTTTDIGALEGTRAASQVKLNQLLAQRNTLAGEERINLNRTISEEIRRNRLIEQRIERLQTAEALQNRTPAEGPGVFGKTGLRGVVARTAAYGGASMALFGALSQAQQAASFTMEFEDALAKLGAIANATGPELEQLKGSILGIGESSRFSLIELTEVATKLAQAGVTASSMSGALKSVSTLAAASGSTTAEAVDLVTAALGSFQLQGSETGRVADMITSALNRTRLTVQQAALAIQYVGTTAYEQNISLEQLLATTAALSQAGIRSGSTIGTGFRQFLVDLQTPSEKLTAQFKLLGISQEEINVSTQGLPTVLATLKEKGFGAAQAYGALETRAAAFYLVAKNNLQLMNDLQISFADSGAAALAQERAMNSLSAQFQRFKNIVGESFAGSAESILTISKNLLTQISDRLSQVQKEAEAAKNTPDPAWYNKDLTAGLSRGVELNLNVLTPFGFGKEKGLGTYLVNLGKDASDATGKMQGLEAALNTTSDATNKQRETVGGLDREIIRLITQKESLRGKTQLVTAETVTLMSRFEGLSSHITGATGDVGGLIGALQRLRNEEAQTLVDNIKAEAGALQARSLDARESRNAALRNIQSNPDLIAALKPKERGALRVLDGPQGRVAADILLRASERFAENNNDWAKLLAAAGSNQQAMFSNDGRQRILRGEASQLEAGRTGFGQQISGNLAVVTGALERLRVADGPKQSSIKAEVDRILNATEQAIKARLKMTLQPGSRQFLQSSLGEVTSSRQQATAIMTPSAAQGRAGDKQAQMISFGSPVQGTPAIVSRVGKRKSPGGIGSTNHQGVDIAGRPGDPVYAAADGVVASAGARGGYGNLVVIDHGGGTETRYAHLSVIDVTVGQEVAKGDKIGRIGMTGNTTGPHLHFERRVGGKVDANPLSSEARGNMSDASDKAAKLQRRAEEEAARAKDRAEREAAALQSAELRNAERDLNGKLKGLKYATTKTLFDVGVASADSAFDAWAKELREATQADLKKRDATAGEAKNRMAEVEEQITLRREDIQNTIFDFFLKGIEKQLEAIEDSVKAQLTPFENGVALAQGRLDGLGFQSLEGKVPDYVRENAQRQVGVAQENFARAKSGALGSEIGGKNNVLNDLKLSKLTETDPVKIEQINTQIAQLSLTIAGLRNEKTQLDASLGAGDMVPTTISGAWAMVVQNFNAAHQATATWGDMIRNNLGGALETVSGSMETFLTDIMSGTMSVQSAFKSMVKGIIQYLIQLIAKMIVVKLLQMAIGGGSAPASAPGTPITYAFNGGEIGRVGGGRVENGEAGRDSVHTKLARGEWVVRKSAVDSVGSEFMARLNNRGKDAISGSSPKIIMPPAANQNMNVYVVAPEEKPQMGPNDVLVTIANDIQRGGQTKQLIRHVSQGG